MNEAQIGSLSSMPGGGSIARRLLASNMDVEKALRTNATLRNDEWKDIDTAVVNAAQQRLNGIEDLMSRGLVRRTNGLAKTVLEYEDVSDMNDAEIAMQAQMQGQNDRLEFDLKALPLPIIFKDFQIDIRVLSASRTTGESLDAMQASLAAFKVAEKAETLLFQGSGDFTYGGGTIYGYEDAPNRNTVSLTEDWDASGKTGTEIMDDIRAMKQASIDDRHYGPWMLYIPTAYETVLDDDFKAASDKGLRQRIAELSGLIDTKVADKLTANNVIMAQMTVDTIRMVEGLPIQTVEWDSVGGMLFHFKVMTILVPQVRSDQNSRSGIVHLS